tara:strand:+ start:65 stop:586 length:522 start_codon:yes stop_codon:yes gene_type:complete
MKYLLIAPLILGLTAPVQAKDTCTFTSQYQPEVTIELNAKHGSGAMGLMKYRGSPVFYFSTGVQNGYGGQSFSISTIPNSSTNKRETIVSGQAVTVVGDQASSKGTPENKRKKGQKKLFFPKFGLNYYYSLSPDVNEPDSRFNLTKKSIAILKAAEGFWIPSKKCEKYVYYAW